MNVLVAGYGTIGRAIYKYVNKFHDVQWLDVEEKNIDLPIDVLEICYPYEIEDFVGTTAEYIKRFNPKLLTIIESTIMPWTTVKIHNETGAPLVHSPVRGNPENWTRWVKMIGPMQREYGLKAQEYYESMGLKTYVCKSPLETEWGKLFSTTIYALNIAHTQEINRICEFFKVDFGEAYIKFSETFTLDPNYTIPRPVFYPGVIGKRCLIPNIHLLKQCFNSKFLDAILESNELRKREMGAERE